MPAGQPSLLGQTGPLHRGQAVGGTLPFQGGRAGRLLAWLAAAVRPRGGEGGGESPDTSLATPNARDSRDRVPRHAATAPHRSGVPCHRPGEIPPSRGAQGHHLAAGRPPGLWACRHPPAA